MNKQLQDMLRTSAEADMAKAKLTLDLLGEKSVGIGDHSTKDFYNNAEEALELLDSAYSRLDTLNRFLEEDQ